MRIDKTVGVVTGGASGIGEGVVRMLVKEGGRAAILDLPGSDGAALAEELGDSVEFFALDVTNPAEVEATVPDDVLAAFRAWRRGAAQPGR